MAKTKHKEDKWIALFLIIALLAMAVFFLVRCGAQEKDSWQEQYDLGVRYLDDGNYEEAVLSFLAAIEIDPKRSPAYSGAAEAYLALGDYEAAVEILAEGIENTGDEDLKEELEELEEDLREDGLLPTGEPPKKPTVVDAYSDYAATGLEAYGEPSTTCYHIPKILLADGTEAEANEAIYQELYGILEEHVYQFGDEANNSMLYHWYQKDDYISVVAQIDYFGDFYWTYYKVYLVSATTGELLSNLEMLNAYGYTEETFHEAVFARLSAYFTSYENLRDQVGETEYNNVVSATTAEENLRQTVPFVGPDGELYILAHVYWPAGAGAYWRIMPLEEIEAVGMFFCTVDHGAGSAESDAYTASDIRSMVVDYYNQNMEYRYEGNFAAFEGETFENGNECHVIVRFQHSEDDPTIGANLLVAEVVVDLTTGEMTADGEYLDDLW